MAEVDKIFDGIRPYYDSEIPASIERMKKHPYLEEIANFLKIKGGIEHLVNMLSACKTVDDFQDKIMVLVVSTILEHTSNGVTHSGLHYFSGNQKHLIITNHRDIVLDSAIIQLILHTHKVTTTEIAVGDNLITSQFIEDVARSNKMIKVTRSSSPREVYNSSMLLSKYIRHNVATQTSSIWIAQRNGRTKDGFDQTEQGLLKMLEMSGKGDFITDMDELSIMPVAISYEFEPCDALKTRELYVSRRCRYVKEEGEDLHSIITGIALWKGGIHIDFTEPIRTEQIASCAAFSKNERFVELGKIIDKRIHSYFKLWPNNFIAYDLLMAEENIEPEFFAEYSSQQKNAFEAHMEKQLSYIESHACPIDGEEWNRSELREIFLNIYANPVRASLK
ncbi:MAG: 1-acyl-sn-glycerol-3-phosphate acyltransferase [Bacteroidales bacterium]|nr:1-acyl-sn-glycerol-3-phosphate acyltransferase [Bacteroidales bacterium]